MIDSNEDPVAAPVSSFGQGARAVGGAIRYLTSHPELWPKVAVPIFLTFLFFAVTIPLFFMLPVWSFDSFDLVGPTPSPQAGDDATARSEIRASAYALVWVTIMRSVGSMGQALLWLLWLLTSVALTYLLFSTVGMAIMGSFMDSLTHLVEVQLGVAQDVEPPRVEGWVQSVRDTTYLVGRNLIWTIVLLPLLLVPFAGAIAFFLLGAHFMASEQLEYPMVRRGWAREQRNHWRRKHKSAARGMGMTGAALMMIPFVNLLVLPVAATAGTLLFCRIEYPTHRAANRRR